VPSLSAVTAAVAPLHFRDLGTTDYLATLERMRDHVRGRIAARAAGTADPGDEVWFTEHRPVFTLGRSARRDHLHDAGNIAVVETERGGHVTFHGPGQIVVYPLLDLQRRGLGVRRYVCALEEAVIATLAVAGVAGRRRPGAPGLYVDSGAKIASIGLKVNYGFSYHGLALNVAMDLEPFARIDPCGYAGLAVTDIERERPGDRQAIDMTRLQSSLRDALRHVLER
jgi:lipoyl(octanoyl) transferase